MSDVLCVCGKPRKAHDVETIEGCSGWIRASSTEGRRIVEREKRAGSQRTSAIENSGPKPDPLTKEDVAARAERPTKRSECEAGQRPCPWVTCRHHLYLDIHPITGSLKINHPGKEWDELEQTCSLDVASRGGETLDVVGRLLNLTRERIRQQEGEVLRKLNRQNPALMRALEP